MHLGNIQMLLEYISHSFVSNWIKRYRKLIRCAQVLIMIFYFAEVVDLCVPDATNKPYSALKIQLESKHECITEY